MCADAKISALTEATTLAGTEDTVVVQGGTTKRVGIDTMFSTANAYAHHWVHPYSADWAGTAGAYMTSTAFDGDSFSTTAKTVIDLSASFGVPAGVRSVNVVVNVRDSASTSTYSYMYLAPNNTADKGHIFAASSGVNDRYTPGSAIVPTDANGDIYYQIVASGASTFDVVIQIAGYEV